MEIIGIGGWDHDANVAIVRSADIVAVGEEERFTREKYKGHQYKRSIDFCLEHSTDNHIRVAAVGFKNPRIFNRIVERARIRQQLHRTEFIPVDHHASHSAATFYGSGFKDALIVTLDGYGDGVCATASLANQKGFDPIWEVPYPHSLGLLWTSTNLLLGFGMRDAGKLMGLAAYGEPRYQDILLDAVRLLPDGRYEFAFDGRHSETFRHSDHSLLLPVLGRPRRPDHPIEQVHMDIAASLQKATETIVLHMLQRLHAPHSTRNLCLAGGVALNSSLNGIIARESNFNHIFIPPNPGDSGTGTGSALYVMGQGGNVPMISRTRAYLGIDYSQREIEEFLKAQGVSYRCELNIERAVARRLEQGKIVGWFQGRAEVGPRALGNRSILADPRDALMKDRLNRSVKFREWFRPFAPSVLARHSQSWFEFRTESPFMSYVASVVPSRRAEVPAITHVDGTARLQTITPEQNQRFYTLIEQFLLLTGVPMVLNTSFNTMGEPIVNSPDDALCCFQNSGMDALALGNALIEK